MRIQIELGHTYAEWQKKAEKEDLWDFSLEDMSNGAVEPRKDIVYWLIQDKDGEYRLCESGERTQNPLEAGVEDEVRFYAKNYLGRELEEVEVEAITNGVTGGHELLWEHFNNAIQEEIDNLDNE